MKKMNRFAACALIFSGIFSAAQADDLPRWVLASVKSMGSPVARRQKADQMVLPLTLTSRQSSPEKRIEELNQATEELMELADDDSDISLMETRMDYSAGAAAGLPNIQFGEKRTSTVTFYISVSPKFRKDAFFDRALALTSFADQLAFGTVTLTLGKVQLCTKNPEQYRAKLLTHIMSEISLLRKLTGPETILHISGLERPVEVRQIDQENVELFIRYELTLEQLKSKDPTVHSEEEAGSNNNGEAHS